MFLRTSNYKRFLYWLPTILYAAAILSMTLRPVPRLPARNLDKVVHFFAYAVLAMSMHLPLRRSLGSRHAILAAVFAMAIGALDETLQIFSPYRTASFFDFLADAAGAVVGTVMMRFIYHRQGEKRVS